MDLKYGFVYEGNKTREISFPLGGIGAGCVGLGGNGRLMDFEIFNRPNKCSYNGYSGLAVKAEDESGVVDARCLQGDMLSGYTGDPLGNYGHGVNQQSMAGCPHFERSSFTGAFPFARVDLSDGHFPGQVSLTAGNPFIPLNDKDSSLPGAFFELAFTNPTERALTYTAAFFLANPAAGKNRHVFHEKPGVSYLVLDNDNHAPDAAEYGHLCIATDSDAAAHQNYWYRGSWADPLTVFWKSFSMPGKITNREYEGGAGTGRDTAVLSASVRLAPGETKSVTFVLAWYYPNYSNYWNPLRDESGAPLPTLWKNYYATLFRSAADCAVYMLENAERLLGDSLIFQNALFSSDLPESVLDAVTSSLSVLKSPTCLRLEDGSFYAFEGCNKNSGSCEGSCTHVWNYAYALPFLFPALERSMRELDFKHNMDEFGGMAFRLMLPPGRKRSGFRPCADGQLGGVVKVYRDWKISGDDAWLKRLWPQVKRCIAYAWSEGNPDRWDSGKTGVLTGRQHHTLDMELFGPNSWLTGFYLAALKSAAEMAGYLEDWEAGAEYTELFAKGKRYVEENLFNGEFFFQKIDLKDRSVTASFRNAEGYWNEEAGETKYQIGEGCGIDQVVAQWHANICGLGEIFDREKVRSALRSVYRYNYVKDFRSFFNPCRIYCLNGETGTVICSWPDADKKPLIPVPYAEETMHGFEYQLAAHMLQEGMIREGTELIKAVRDRYDGEKRNPWNELECGSNYARSMSVYTALTAFSGFTFDSPGRAIGFNPVAEEDFQCFWCLNTGWGMFEKNASGACVRLLYGEITLRTVRLPFLDVQRVALNGEDLAFGQSPGVTLEEPVTLRRGDVLAFYADTDVSAGGNTIKGRDTL